MRTFAIAAMMIALLSASAVAQQQQRGPKTTRSDADKQTDAEIDKAYQKAVKSTAGQSEPAYSDPWKVVRPPSGGSDKR